MEKLKGEMDQFLKEHGMNVVLVSDGWIQYVQLLVQVLVNQPINNPTDNIALFSFLPANQRCVRGIIKLKQPINSRNEYTFGNKY